MASSTTPRAPQPSQKPRVSGREPDLIGVEAKPERVADHHGTQLSHASKIVATPCPWPTHIVAMPSLAPWSRMR